MNRMHRNSFTSRQGAISTEYVIILVLIAVAGILGFMFLGQQLRNQSRNITDKVAGTSQTNVGVERIGTEELTEDRNDMTGKASGEAEAQVPTGTQ